MKRISIIAAVVAAAGVLAIGTLVVARTFTDSTGTYKIEAEFVEFKQGRAVLARPDGTTIEVPMSKLSKADQDYIREQLRSGGPPAESNTVATEAPAGTDWPTWRGPNRDGISTETELLDSWPQDGPPLLWSARGFGNGYSSVAIVGDKIYTMGNKNGRTHMICASANDGSEIWATGFSGGKPNCTPTVDGDRVYGLAHDGGFVCCDAASGEIKWQTHFERDLRGKMMSGWGYSESPLIDGDRLICTPGAQNGILVALNKLNGEVVWKSSMPYGGSRGNDGAAYSSPVISNAAGVKQYVQLVGRGIVSVRASDGELLWGYDRVANGTANVPTPIAMGDYIFCSSGYGDGGSALLKISNSRGRMAAEEVYYKSNNEIQNHHGGMILLGDYIYMGHGHNRGLPLCLKAGTGEVAWGPERGPGGGSAAIVFADGNLYFRYEDGVMALIEASPRGYNLKSSFRIPTNNDKHWPHPVISNKKLYLRDGDVLHCYNIAG